MNHENAPTVVAIEFGVEVPASAELPGPVQETGDADYPVGVNRYVV